MPFYCKNSVKSTHSLLVGVKFRNFHYVTKIFLKFLFHTLKNNDSTRPTFFALFKVSKLFEIASLKCYIYKIAKFSLKKFSKNCIPILKFKNGNYQIFQMWNFLKLLNFFIFQNVNYLFETTFPFLMTQSITWSKPPNW